MPVPNQYKKAGEEEVLTSLKNQASSSHYRKGNKG